MKINREKIRKHIFKWQMVIYAIIKQKIVDLSMLEVCSETYHMSDSLLFRIDLELSRIDLLCYPFDVI